MENREINCENCVYYDTDRNDMPCFCCNCYSNWEVDKENEKKN